MRRREICSRHSQTGTERIAPANKDDNWFGHRHRIEHRNQVLRYAFPPGGKFQVTVGSMKGAARPKSVFGDAGINLWDAYHQRRRRQAAPQQQMCDAPARPVGRHSGMLQARPQPNRISRFTNRVLVREN